MKEEHCRGGREEIRKGGSVRMKGHSRGEPKGDNYPS